ncbi:glycosyltransferase family 31 protein [Aaosphaeria arxii CBS 175.79]|uniref:N-acetylgalactosaminide beta-1,3-galactosyltransferase n=1 Tax=Aaosphaeria arxii CBS 175.79 TaxID=1450172 RepID=A0A6A5XR94_9PLEO|nr:glycosyltransferase family 31 protein [Aaosphaeria arxii CBS 175.79]KAF2014824.1 glycosyltransferase family 31 protein [Aaosphaeria arxii CBS 175.79]
MLRLILLRLSRRPWKFLFPVLLLFFFALHLSRSRQPQQPSAVYYKTKTKSYFPPQKHKGSNFCDNFPTDQLQDVQIVLKTGAGDAERNKAHLATVSSCITNLIIVSDHEEKVGDRQIIDILAELPASYTINNTDFQSYAEHRKASAEGEKIKYSAAGWKLDRFKFLPMVDKAYEVNPKAKWYVFVESDVYFFWDTLFRLLDQHDHTEPHYMGSPVAGSNDRYFAYGGAGFVLSSGLMKRLLPPKPSGGVEKLSHRYEQWVKEDRCGDAVLAYAILNSTGTRLEALYPTFSGDELKHLKIDRDRWCVPLLSVHRLNPEQMESLWNWERTRPYNPKPLVFSSLLAYTHGFLRDGPSREFWDNLSEAPVPNDRPAHKNAGSCGSECENDPHCLQWSYSQTVCRFANYIKLGNAVDRENGGQGEFTCGWALGKMAELGFKVDEESDINDTCQEATWLTPQVR